jgi:hypothetical protein
MLTPKQLAANRANALKSTGPRTPAGKARSALNGFTHGLHSSHLLAPTESRQTFNRHAARIRRCLAPADPIESLLVDRIIAASWRIRRAHIIETRIFHQRSREIEFDYQRKDELAEILRFSEDAFERAGAMEARLEKSLHAALDQLFRLRANSARYSRKPHTEPKLVSTQPAETTDDHPESEAA